MAETSRPKQLTEYTIPVHRSIIHRDLWLGLPFIVLILLIFITIFMVFAFEQLAFLIVTVILWFILRQITKADEWLIDIILSSVLQPDDLR